MNTKTLRLALGPDSGVARLLEVAPGRLATDQEREARCLRTLAARDPSRRRHRHRRLGLSHARNFAMTRHDWPAGELRRWTTPDLVSLAVGIREVLHRRAGKPAEDLATDQELEAR